MQLEECSDASFACSVGLQSTPSRVIRAMVEGREILSAANGSGAVEDDGDTCVITTWAASVSDVCAGSRVSAGARRRSTLAARATAELLRLRARPGVQSGALSTWFPASSAAGGTACVPIVVARIGAGIANT